MTTGAGGMFEIQVTRKYVDGKTAERKWPKQYKTETGARKAALALSYRCPSYDSQAIVVSIDKKSK